MAKLLLSLTTLLCVLHLGEQFTIVPVTESVVCKELTDANSGSPLQGLLCITKTLLQLLGVKIFDCPPGSVANDECITANGVKGYCCNGACGGKFTCYTA